MGTVVHAPLEIADELSRRGFLGGVVAFGTLGGCASGAAPAAPGPPTPVHIEHDGGVVTLPRIPSRIVTLGEEVTEFAAVLDVQPVGVGSGRVDATRGDQALEGYYLTPAQIGNPRYVGTGPFNLEAIAGLRPDLIVHSYQDDQIADLRKIAPTVLYEFYGVTGSWQESLRKLGAGLARAAQAAAAVAAYEGAATSNESKLSATASTAGRVAVVWPNYRDRGANYIYAAAHPVARPLLDLGFDVVTGALRTEPNGYAEISTELLGDLDTDTIFVLGPKNWTETPAAAVLGSATIPVVWVPAPSTQPTTGPITARNRLDGYAAALLTGRR